MHKRLAGLSMLCLIMLDLATMLHRGQEQLYSQSTFPCT